MTAGPRTIEIAPNERARYEARIASIERDVTYPLGDDRFRIDHGPSYFAFFDRLGEAHTFATLDEEDVLAVVTFVLRRVPHGIEDVETWYVCDLKTRRDARARGSAGRLLADAAARLAERCPRAYAISMNPGDGSANPVVRMLTRGRDAHLEVATTLTFFSLDEARMRAVAPLVEAARGPVSYLSLRGTKDIVLESTRAPMPLLHAQFGPLGERASAAAGTGVARCSPAPRTGHVHMFCAPHDDELVRACVDRGCAPSASATLMHHGLAGCDWRFVLTSDI